MPYDADMNKMFHLRDQPPVCKACGDEIIDIWAAWTNGKGIFWHNQCAGPTLGANEGFGKTPGFERQ